MKLIERKVEYTDKTTGEMKYFYKTILVVDCTEKSIEIEITGAGKDSRKISNDNLLRAFAVKEM